MRVLLKRLNAEVEPPEEEVQIIVQAVDRRGGSTDGGIDRQELKEAICEWRKYQATTHQIQHLVLTASCDHRKTHNSSRRSLLCMILIARGH